MSKHNRKRNKGPKRAHMKRFSGEYINAGMKLNSAYLGDMYQRVQSLKKVKLADYKEMHGDSYRAQELKPEPVDVVVFNLSRLWQGPFNQGKERFYRQNIVQSPKRNMFFLFGRIGCYIVAEYPNGLGELFKPGTVRISMLYPTTRLAQMAFSANAIKWQWTGVSQEPLLTQRNTPRLQMERKKFGAPD